MEKRIELEKRGRQPGEVSVYFLTIKISSHIYILHTLTCQYMCSGIIR